MSRWLAPLWIDYLPKRRQELTTRSIRPVRLERANGAEALVAWCHLREAPRRFLMSGVVGLIDPETGELMSDSPRIRAAIVRAIAARQSNQSAKET